MASYQGRYDWQEFAGDRVPDVTNQARLHLTPQQRWQAGLAGGNDLQSGIDDFASFVDSTFTIDAAFADLSAPLSAGQYLANDWQVLNEGACGWPLQDVYSGNGTSNALQHEQQAEASDSDRSWEDEGGWLAFRSILKSQLQEFAADDTQTLLAINPLPKNQRRVVHAIADTWGFTHESQGRGKMRSIVLTKPMFWTTPFATEDSSSQHVCRTCTSPSQSSALPRASSFASSSMPRTFSGKTLASLAESSMDCSYATSATSESVMSKKKRKRNPKLPGGYPCGSCTKSFDRECERAKHEKYHLEDEQRPYRCEMCTKGYLLLKDLKDHEERAHPRRQGARAKFFF